MNIENKAVTIDGTNGGDIRVWPNYRNTQLAVAGRSTGLITVTAKALGADVFESFSPELQLDLSIERTAVIQGYSLIRLNFEIDPSGPDFTVKTTQWNDS